MAKYGHVREGGKVGRSDATPTNFFSVDSNNLKSMSFKFGNDIFITFEMPGVAYSMSFDKIHISLQFRPSVIRSPWLSLLQPETGQVMPSPLSTPPPPRTFKPSYGPGEATTALHHACFIVVTIATIPKSLA